MKLKLRTRRAVSALMAIAIAAVVQQASGQMTPDAPKTAPPVSTGNWWDSSQMPVPQPPMPSRPPSANTDFPTLQLNDWVMANAMSARARAVLAQSQTDLSAAIRRAHEHFERSDDYAKAAAAEKQAYIDYTTARQTALKDVYNNPKYIAVSMLRDQLAEKIAALRAAKDAPPGEIVAMATLKMQYGTDVRGMEVSALSADDNVKATREKMIEASRKVADMKSRFDDSIPDMPEVAGARNRVAQAHIAVVETSALACGASLVSDYAINYSYYLHRNDNGGLYGPYGQGGIGGGYSSPYWSH